MCVHPDSELRVLEMHTSGVGIKWLACQFIVGHEVVFDVKQSDIKKLACQFYMRLT